MHRTDRYGRNLPYFELLVVLVLWVSPIFILSGPSEAIHLGIWVCYQPKNYTPVKKLQVIDLSIV